jgi:tetratricopeptide (TPR) repeat protein
MVSGGGANAAPPPSADQDFMKLSRTTVIAAVALAAVIVAVVAQRGVRSQERSLLERPQAPSTLGRLTSAQALVEQNPSSSSALAELAGAALTQVRETGDPSWYRVASQAATRAISIDRTNVDAIDTLGALALARHRFTSALEWSRRSTVVAPSRFAPLSIRADALIELGRYREGFSAVERRLALRPDLNSYSRASYARELVGDREGAIQLMGLAAESGRPGGEPRAWARTQLGLLRFGSGDLTGAEREMNLALKERPNDARALGSLARVRAGRGDLDGAATLYAQAIDRLPLPEYPAALVEIALAKGDRDGARVARATVSAMSRLQTAAGVRGDLDLALIGADDGVPNAGDVRRARVAYLQRPGIIGDDILGWVLTRSGRCSEGLTYARRSMRLGTRDASMHFHYAMAAACAGRPTEARAQFRAALRLNPAFSVRWSPVARRTLAGLA